MCSSVGIEPILGLPPAAPLFTVAAKGISSLSPAEEGAIFIVAGDGDSGHPICLSHVPQSHCPTVPHTEEARVDAVSESNFKFSIYPPHQLGLQGRIV